MRIFSGIMHALEGVTIALDAIRANKLVATEDAFLLSRSGLIDIICDVTGSVEFGAHVVLEAFKHGKDVVLMNAEIDATIGPILQVYAKKYGVILSACDGDEPGPSEAAFVASNSPNGGLIVRSCAHRVSSCSTGEVQ